MHSCSEPQTAQQFGDTCSNIHCSNFLGAVGTYGEISNALSIGPPDRPASRFGKAAQFGSIGTNHKYTARALASTTAKSNPAPVR